ncbi:hypothetical protein JTE90_029506 [Oedothorax gibbosus]|uniref:Uncharacterized protein n=1 Tax=Oedothorax gibbosus TaxID=931172 RepID=A0AAV6UHK7_9ARAC|nr:hypothetical protein JTE90_029506 [Oedothorax gibbosus]
MAKKDVSIHLGPCAAMQFEEAISAASCSSGWGTGRGPLELFTAFGRGSRQDSDMGVAINVVACLLLIAFSITSAQIDCEKSVHESCRRDVSLHKSYTGFRASEKFLEEHCSDIQEDLSCKHDYLRTCDPTTYKLFSSLINGVTNMLTNLCNETSDLRRAIESAQRHTSLYGTGLYNSGLEQIARFCRFQGSFRSCTIMVAKKYCGKCAGQYISSLYEITIQGMVSQLC